MSFSKTAGDELDLGIGLFFIVEIRSEFRGSKAFEQSGQIT